MNRVILDPVSKRFVDTGEKRLGKSPPSLVNITQKKPGKK